MATEKRLIDANALDGVLKDFESRYQKAYFALSAKAISNARQIVYAMKTVDAVEVVHGRWIAVGGNHHTRISQCTNCCAKYDFRSNYCPNCGAKMDGGKDND